MLNNAYALKIFFSLPGIVYHTNALSQLERTLDVGIDMRMASHSGARHPSPFAFSHFLFVSPPKMELGLLVLVMEWLSNDPRFSLQQTSCGGLQGGFYFHRAAKMKTKSRRSKESKLLESYPSTSTKNESPIYCLRNKTSQTAVAQML